MERRDPFLYPREISVDRPPIRRPFSPWSGRTKDENRKCENRGGTFEIHDISHTPGFEVQPTASPVQNKRKFVSIYRLTRVVSSSCEILPSFLPPSLPPTRGELAGPILQYLYFSMLKPRYTINYINKLWSSILSSAWPLSDFVLLLISRWRG